MASNRTTFYLTICALGAAVGCGGPPETTATSAFDVGGNGDPIIAAVKQAVVGAPVANDTVTFILANASGYNLNDGLVTTVPIFTLGSVPSVAFSDYTSSSSANHGNPTKLATAMGLVLNQNAFIISSLQNGKTATITISVPPNSKLSFVASVSGAVDDFAGIQSLALNSISPGANTIAVGGFDPNDGAGGTTVIATGTIGANPNIKMTFQNQSDCTSGVLARRTNLINDTFSTGPNDSNWPRNGAGWDGDFGGDWYTDGTTARVWNPNWGGGGPIDVVTGFWKFFDICPASGSRLSIDTQMATTYTTIASDTTLVLYYFDRYGGLIRVDTSGTLHGLYGARSFSLFDSAIPAGARKIAIAPMARLSPTEQGTVFYDSLRADYETSDTYAVTSTVATDTFTTCGTSNYGQQQPSGWAEFGGDYYCLPPNAWVTLGNPAWYSKPLPVDTGLTKTFTLAAFPSGSEISISALAAATYTDLNSFVRLRVTFNDAAATTFDSERAGLGYGPLQIRRKAIPPTATKATVIINGYLGSKETQSLYATNFLMTVGHPLP